MLYLKRGIKQRLFTFSWYSASKSKQEAQVQNKHKGNPLHGEVFSFLSLNSFPPVSVVEKLAYPRSLTSSSVRLLARPEDKVIKAYDLALMSAT